MATPDVTVVIDGNPGEAENASPGRASVFTVGTAGAQSPSRAGEHGASAVAAQAGVAIDPASSADAEASVTRQISGETEVDILEQHLMQPDLPTALLAYMSSIQEPPQWNTWQKAFYFYARHYEDTLSVQLVKPGALGHFLPSRIRSLRPRCFRTWMERSPSWYS